MKKIETKKQFDEIIRDSPNVLADFSASWCGPCKVLIPQLEEAEVSLKEDQSMESIEFVKVDVDDENLREIVSYYSIKNVPTVIAFKNGDVSGKFIGVKTKNQIIDFLRTSLK